MKLSCSNFFSVITRFIFCISVWALFLQNSDAQELNASVTVDRSSISNVSVGYLDSFAEQIEEYLNDYDWTDTNFNSEERINVFIQINLLEVDQDYNFEASAIIRTQRPVYNTVQQTPLFFFNDESLFFNFPPNSTLTHDELQFDDLATILDYYAYIILGFDFDSFSELGGTSYFTEANRLVALGQSAGSNGWSRSVNSRRNRAELVANLQNPNLETFRRAVYRYHRHGVDRFLDDAEQARQEIISALKLMQEARKNTTGDLLPDVFFNAKYREIVSIFEDASSEVRREAFELLSEIDPNHLSEYRKLQP